MPRMRQETREQTLADTRRQLLEAATAEFAQKGYEAANINRISQAAGFAKGTIYNYFPSKRALMLALVDEIAASHTQFILDQVGPEQDPILRLQRFFSAGFAFVERHPAQIRSMIIAVYGPDPEVRARVYQSYNRLFTFIIEDIVKAGIARGNFSSVDPDLITALLMTIYLGSCSQVDADGKIWLDPSQITEFVLNGLLIRTALP